MKLSAKLSICDYIQFGSPFHSWDGIQRNCTCGIGNLGPQPGKANPNSADEQGHVAINDAVAKDRFDLVTKLLEYGALVTWLR